MQYICSKIHMIENFIKKLIDNLFITDKVK